MSIQTKDLPLFATRLKAAREKTGISQMDLGVKAGIDEYSASARINQNERGKHTPDYSTACNLARVLSVPVAYFYAEDDAMADLITMYGKLDTTSQKRLLGSIKSLIDSNLMM
jgi:transcriptional regulator with XRE-family HTH domain